MCKYNKNTIFFATTLFLVVFLFYKTNNVIALDYYNNTPERIESRIRTLETESFNQDMESYESPASSTARLIMEMTAENAKKEEIKNEILNEIKTQEKATEKIKECGENYRYNFSLNECECEDEYKLYKDKCLEKLEYWNEYCKETLGINSIYNPDEDNCITNEDHCKKILGENSKYLISEDKCVCKLGFDLNENNCIAEKQPEIIKIENPGIREKIGNFFNKLKFW